MSEEKRKPGRPPKVQDVIPEAPPIQTEVGAAELQALNQIREFEFRGPRRGEGTAILPGGRRISAPPFLQASYNLQNAAATVLGAPENIVKPSHRAAHRGWHYAWPVALHAQTQAFIRSNVYEKVAFEDVDDTNPLAAVTKTPEGDTMWMQHLLVCIPPDKWALLKTNPELTSISKTAQNRAMVEAQLNESFGGAGYTAQVSVEDQREERIT